MTDFRALCAELLDELDFQSSHHSAVDLKARARAALAQPEPVGATDEVAHILKLAAIIREVDGGNKLGAASLAEAILSHRDNCWSRPAIEPVPVAERLPGQEDCDAEGKCWWWHPDHKEDEFTDGWMSLDPKWADGHHDADDSPVYTHWLPYDALPVPQREGSDD